jgi:hypothetical protein
MITAFINKRLNPLYAPENLRGLHFPFGGFKTIFYDWKPVSSVIDGTVQASGTFFDQSLTIPIASLQSGDVLWTRIIILVTSSGKNCYVTNNFGSFPASLLTLSSASSSFSYYTESNLRVISTGLSGAVSGINLTDYDINSGVSSYACDIGAASNISLDLSTNILINSECYWESGSTSSEEAKISIEAAIMRQ